MKTAASMPDTTFVRATTEAAARGMSRSELVTGPCRTTSGLPRDLRRERHLARHGWCKVDLHDHVGTLPFAVVRQLDDGLLRVLSL